jgi:hypothetical protein
LSDKWTDSSDGELDVNSRGFPATFYHRLTEGRSTWALDDREPPEKTLPRESELIK